MKPCSSGLPFLCIKPVIFDNDEGGKLNGKDYGCLAIEYPFLGIVRTLHNDHDNYTETYFKMFPGYFYCGDGMFYLFLI